MPVDMRRVDSFESRGPRGRPGGRRPAGPTHPPATSTVAPVAAPAGATTDETVAAEDYGFDLPESWGGLEEFWSNAMGGGMDVGMGPQYENAMNWMQNYMQEGMPVDIAQYEEMRRPLHMMELEKAQKQAIERFGLSGIGNSSIATYGLGQIGKEFEAGFASDLAQHWYDAQEADMARRAGFGMALPGAAGIGAGVGLANMGNRMSGANNMLGYGFAPLQLGQGMFNLGQGYQDAEAMAYNQMYDDPMFAQAMQYGMGGPGQQYMPNQYDPGWGTQVMNVGGMLFDQTQQQQNQLASAMAGAPTDFFMDPGGGGASYDFNMGTESPFSW